MIKDLLISKIIAREWEMFESVSNIDGQKASCQEDPETFTLMRRSQAVTWPEPVLESYLNDLEAGAGGGRNLMAEKYARMMASTVPDEYARLSHQLPPIPRENRELIEQIIALNLSWEKEVAEKYPHICQRGRPTYSSQDTAQVTSIETYLRGELMTYSLPTLSLLHDFVTSQASEGKNGSEVILLNVMLGYGFQTLEQAESLLKKGCR